MKNWPLRTKLLIASGFVLFMIVVLNLTFLFSLQKSFKYRALNKQYYEFMLDYNKYLTYQRNFLINFHNDPVFFRTEQSELLRKQDIAFTKVKNDIQSFLESDLVTLDEVNKFNQIRNSVETINNLFKEITHKLYLRGNASTKSGLIGKLIEYYDVASTNCKDPKAKELINAMYMDLLKYLSSLDEKDYQRFLKHNTEFNRLTKQISFTDTGFVVKHYSEKSIVAMEEFKSKFKDLIKLDADLGLLNANSGLIENWRSTIENTNSIAYTLRDKLMDKFQRIFQQSRRSFFIFFILIVAISIGVFVILQNLLVSRFSHIKNYIEPLKYGEIPEQVQLKFHDEIGELISTLNVFISSLKRTAEFAVQLGQGNFDVDFKPLSDRDILGNALLRLRLDLKKAQEEEEKRKEEERIRQWTNEGISKFAEILRQKTDSLQDLASLVIKNLVNYLNANQGAFFYLNDDDKQNPYLELLATYAYSKERKKKKIFKLGEGLVGTAAIEKATIYMTDIPEEYITITSGLGEATPRSLLIVPLKAEEEIVGVIEIASFNEMKDYEIHFVEQVAESIAATVSITKINQRTARLLQQSQLQAREMAAQEEEMRQNLEELKATQEEAARREAELRSLLNAIETATYVTLLDLNGFIIGANDRLLENLGLTHDEYIGHHISEFDEEGKLMDEAFWNDIKEGRTVHYTRHFKIDNNEYWFDEYYAPIIGKQSEVLRFIAISFDITPRIKQQQILEAQKQELIEKEEQLRQNMKELELTKEYLEQQKEEAEKLAHKLKTNEEILKHALEETKRKQEQAEQLSIKLEKDKVKLAAEYEDYLSSKEMLAYLQRRTEKQVEQVNDLKSQLEDKEKEIERLKKEIEDLKKQGK